MLCSAHYDILKVYSCEGKASPMPLPPSETLSVNTTVSTQIFQPSNLISRCTFSELLFIIILRVKQIVLNHSINIGSSTNTEMPLWPNKLTHQLRKNLLKVLDVHPLTILGLCLFL